MELVCAFPKQSASANSRRLFFGAGAILAAPCNRLLVETLKHGKAHWRVEPLGAGRQGAGQPKRLQLNRAAPPQLGSEAGGWSGLGTLTADGAVAAAGGGS